MKQLTPPRVCSLVHTEPRPALRRARSSPSTRRAACPPTARAAGSHDEQVLERDLYEHDFFAWTRLQSKELRRFARTRPNLPLDLDRIAAEIAGLGKAQRNAVRSWTIRIIEHLLLLEHSPAEAPRRGWRREVMTFRDEIEDRAEQSLGQQARIRGW